MRLRPPSECRQHNRGVCMTRSSHYVGSWLLIQGLMSYLNCTNDNNLTKKEGRLIPLSLVIKIICFGVTNNEPHLLHLLRSFWHGEWEWIQTERCHSWRHDGLLEHSGDCCGGAERGSSHGWHVYGCAFGTTLRHLSAWQTSTISPHCVLQTNVKLQFKAIDDNVMSVIWVLLLGITDKIKPLA